ncbi:hypothetical protein [Clostridium sp.]|jgi:hypothetical protein|uniref:hypothetical protein n=1 Tax=Clostridium sp. TaxID=1506 RepID=UPI003A5C02D2
MSKVKFHQLIKENLKEILKDKDIKDLFYTICKNTSEFYNDNQVIVCERFTKRISYITGAGKDRFTSQKKIELDGRYIVFLQGFEEVPKWEIDILISIFKIAVEISKK